MYNSAIRQTPCLSAFAERHDTMHLKHSGNDVKINYYKMKLKLFDFRSVSLGTAQIMFLEPINVFNQKDNVWFETLQRVKFTDKNYDR